jgi:NNP family nitrate/nitrite transporter-like MFS transporter
LLQLSSFVLPLAACDRFGLRKTFAGCLLVGAIPTFLSGTAYNASKLMALPFFIGILEGTFAPCQVWSTGFFDKNAVGFANAFAAGFGNAGGGITYFLMPANLDLLVSSQHLTPHVAWWVAFVDPSICITTVALGLLFLCPDTSTGKWSDRHLAAQQNLATHSVTGVVVDRSGSVLDKKFGDNSSVIPPPPEGTKEQYVATGERKVSYDHEAHLFEQAMLGIARGEIIAKPTFKETMPVVFSLQTLVTATCYFYSFGSELSINSILGACYLANSKHTLN